MDGGRNHLRAEFEPVRPANAQRLIIHPHDGCLKLIGHFRRCIRGRDHITTRTIDFIRQAQGDGLPGHRLLQIAIERHDFRHGRGFAAGQDADRIPRLY